MKRTILAAVTLVLAVTLQAHERRAHTQDQHRSEKLDTNQNPKNNEYEKFNFCPRSAALC